MESKIGACLMLKGLLQLKDWHHFLATASGGHSPLQCNANSTGEHLSKLFYVYRLISFLCFCPSMRKQAFRKPRQSYTIFYFCTHWLWWGWLWNGSPGSFSCLGSDVAFQIQVQQAHLGLQFLCLWKVSLALHGNRWSPAVADVGPPCMDSPSNGTAEEGFYTSALGRITGTHPLH